MNNELIEFLTFTVKQTEESIVDVTVDSVEREYLIEQTDLYGQLLAPVVGGRLRRSRVEQFQEKLNNLSITSWPTNENDTLPIHLKNASLIYIINDQTFFTTGKNIEGLVELHKIIEELVGTTFGSYEFYT